MNIPRTGDKSLNFTVYPKNVDALIKISNKTTNKNEECSFKSKTGINRRITLDNKLEAGDTIDAKATLIGWKGTEQWMKIR